MSCKTYHQAQIDRVEIERTQAKLDIFIYCGQPGLITGKENAELTKLALAINKIAGRKLKVNINVIPYANTA